jgi:hypothetical protein
MNKKRTLFFLLVFLFLVGAYLYSTSNAGPDTQQKFCKIINQHRDTYREETNTGSPLGRKERLHAIFEKRNTALDNLLSTGAVQGWVGKIRKIYDVSSGAGLIVELPCGTALKATPNKVIIPRGTNLYKLLFQVKLNQKITFSGTLFPRGTFPGGYPEFHAVAFHEDSFTQSGSMNKPEFLFRFDKINPS